MLQNINTADARHIQPNPVDYSTSTFGDPTPDEKAEARRALYERIARGNALAEIEDVAYRRLQR